MTSEQVQTITAVLSGMQAAIVNLSTIVARHTGINVEDLAKSFEATARQVPADAVGREIVQLPLNLIAAAVRNPNAPANWDALKKHLLD